MRRVPLPLLGVLVTAVLAGCGQSNPKLIPQSNADALNQTIAALSTACDEGDRSTARERVTSARQEIDELPRAVDDELAANLKAWVDQIEGRVTKDCRGEPTPEPTETETPEPTPTETATPEDTPTPTATATETATASPTPTATATAPPEPTQSPNPGGGAPAPDGEGDGDGVGDG